VVLEKIKPASAGQERLINALRNESYKVVGVFGPTGVGKTLLSLAYSLDAVREGRYAKVVIVRPMIDVTTGREVSIAEAGESFYKIAREYLADVLGPYVDLAEIDRMIEEGKIEIVDSHFLKGRSFDNTIVFIDDAQNLKIESLLETIVRVGRGSRLIVAADPIFQALRTGKSDPASVLRDILASESRNDVIVVDLGVKDIVREGAKLGLRLLMEYRLRMREMNEEELRALQVIKVKSPDADVITVIDLRRWISQYGISSEHVPGYLVVVKAGHLGRLVGKRGERVQAIEKELKERVRGVELSHNIMPLIRALHPVSWVWKRVKDVDFRGSYIAVEIDEDVFGPFVGQRGVYVRFLEEVTKEMFGIGIRVVPVPPEEAKKSKQKQRRRKRK